MDIIKVENTSYAKYEEVLLRRDSLRKEAEQYHLEYINTFGDLIIKAFEQKVECIKKKKMIAYCQTQMNNGKPIHAVSLDMFIEQEMEEYRNELQVIVKEVKIAKDAEEVPASDITKIKKIYHKLVKMVHPDLHPELSENETVKDYWQRIMIAYTYNQLEEIEGLQVLVAKYLEDEGLQDTDIEIEDIDDKIKGVEEEIQYITTTNPYLYKKLLHDQEAKMNKMQEYLDEIATYEMYAAQLDEVLAGFKIERKLS